MIQLRIVSGAQAGRVFQAHRFPVCIGRAADSDLRLAEDGVWDRHLRIELEPGEGFVLSLEPGAFGVLNGQTFQSSALRNGDLIEIGQTKIQFWLSEAKPRSLRWRESLTWILLALLCLAQVALIYWLSEG